MRPSGIGEREIESTGREEKEREDMCRKKVTVKS